MVKFGHWEIFLECPYGFRLLLWINAPCLRDRHGRLPRCVDVGIGCIPRSLSKKINLWLTTRLSAFTVFLAQHLLTQAEHKAYSPTPPPRVL